MCAFPLRSSIPAYALLLETPTDVHRNVLEGHQCTRIEAQVEKFVTGEPESAFTDVSKFPNPLRQLKDRGGNVRAFGTWCQTDVFDLLVVQAIYRKRDEDGFLARQHQFAERGKRLRETYEAIDHDRVRTKVAEWRDRADLVVFADRDF